MVKFFKHREPLHRASEHVSTECSLLHLHKWDHEMQMTSTQGYPTLLRTSTAPGGWSTLEANIPSEKCKSPHQSFIGALKHVADEMEAAATARRLPADKPKVVHVPDALWEGGEREKEAGGCCQKCLPTATSRTLRNCHVLTHFTIKNYRRTPSQHVHQCQDIVLLKCYIWILTCKLWGITKRTSLQIQHQLYMLMQ